jgi:hypothetical protein
MGVNKEGNSFGGQPETEPLRIRAGPTSSPPDPKSTITPMA